MDFYANDSLGPWTPNNEQHRPQRVKRNPKKNTSHIKNTTDTRNEQSEASLVEKACTSSISSGCCQSNDASCAQQSDSCVKTQGGGT